MTSSGPASVPSTPARGTLAHEAEHSELPTVRMEEVPRRRKGGRRLVRISAGLLFLMLGVVGLFLPVLQGLLFLAIGLLLLAPDFPPARRLVLVGFRRWPRLRRAVPKRFRHAGRGEAE